MRTLQFKAQPTTAFFATVNEMFGGGTLAVGLQGVKTSRYQRVIRKVDNAIHRINHNPADSTVCVVDIYLLDSDLPSG